VARRLAAGPWSWRTLPHVRNGETSARSASARPRTR
jgi:hypothetical protein